MLLHSGQNRIPVPALRRFAGSSPWLRAWLCEKMSIDRWKCDVKPLRGFGRCEMTLERARGMVPRWKRTCLQRPFFVRYSPLNEEIWSVAWPNDVQPFTTSGSVAFSHVMCSLIIDILFILFSNDLPNFFLPSSQNVLTGRRSCFLGKWIGFSEEFRTDGVILEDSPLMDCIRNQIWNYDQGFAILCFFESDIPT
jgi:hypothetical protein